MDRKSILAWSFITGIVLSPAILTWSLVLSPHVWMTRRRST